MSWPPSRAARIQVAFPLPPVARLTHDAVVENLRALGFVRVLADGSPHHLDELPPGLDFTRAGELLVVVDRLVAEPAAAGRMAEAVATAFQEGEGVAIVLVPPLPSGGDRLRFTRFPACSACDTPAATVTPALFSFNNPRGACSQCNGFGATLEYDESLVVPDPARSLADGAIDPWTKPRYETRRRLLARLRAEPRGGPATSPGTSSRRRIAASCCTAGRGATRDLPLPQGPRGEALQAVHPRLPPAVPARPEPARPAAAPGSTPTRSRSGSADDTIAGVACRSIDGIDAVAGERSSLTPFEREVAALILDQLAARLGFLRDVGLGYLTLDRQTRTLSGGEAQRIALANALGSRLVDTLYVLDEPSIGLHPRDTDRLLSLLRRLRDAGNTVLVVEHDLAAIRAGRLHARARARRAASSGGRVVYAGPVAARASSPLTGQYLTGEKRIAVPSAAPARGAALAPDPRRHAAQPPGRRRRHSARRRSPRSPACRGSGKSTLLHDVVYRDLEAPAARRALGQEPSGRAGRARWPRSPGGSCSRTCCWSTRADRPVAALQPDHLHQGVRRDPASSSPPSRWRAQRKYTAATFSFNVPGGRCEACEGAGHVQVEMVFMADVFVPCEDCGGTRFRREVLDVRIQGHSIHDVLQWTVDEAITRFRHQPKLGAALWQLQQVGLGYLRLGQPATTLSGGEAQRLKIARELTQAGKREAGSSTSSTSRPRACTSTTSAC